MVRAAPWTEFHEISWFDDNTVDENAYWLIPSDRVKLELQLKGDEAFDHRVPLARQSVEVLKTIRRLTGRGPLVFPGNRSSFTPLSENAVNYLYHRLGYKGRHVSHGWRSSFSTSMNEHFARQHVGADPRLVLERLIVDLMLAHMPKGLSASEQRYNRAAYMDRRREIAQLWADWIMEGQLAAAALLEGPRRPLSKTR